MYRRLFSSSCALSGFGQKIKIIESAPYLGLLEHRKSLSPYSREQLVRRLLNAGLTHIQVGNINDHSRLPLTQQILQELKDEKYGERVLGAAVTNTETVNRFICSGADELIIPIDTQMPYCVESALLFSTLIPSLTIERYSVRLHIHNAFAIPLTDLTKIIEIYRAVGITDISLLDDENKALPSTVYVTSKVVKELMPANRIAYGFKYQSLGGLANQSSALEENITTFHTSVAGIGNWINTSFLVDFLYRQCLMEDALYAQMSQGLRETQSWLQDEFEQ